MMKMAFPGTKNMNEAMGKMQQMMQGMQGMNRGPRPSHNAGGPKGVMPRGGGGANMDAQLKAAMDMLQKMQKGAKR